MVATKGLDQREVYPAATDIEIAVLYRIAAIRDRAGIDEKQSSLPIVLATETPVQTFDMERMEIIDEVLLMDGVEFPSQVPMLDSHDRFSVRNVLGSIREIAIDGSRLIGRAFFSRREAAQDIFGDFVDGHITDFSVGAHRLESVFVRDGETQTIRGKTFHGPVRVVTRAKVFEGSVVVKGADPNATVQGTATRSAVLMTRAYLEPQVVKEELAMLRDASFANTTHSQEIEMVTMTGSSIDKFIKAASDSLTRQALQSQGLNPHAALERAKLANDFDAMQRAQANVDLMTNPSAESRDLQHAGLFEIARAYCEQAGMRFTPSTPRPEIVRMALAHNGIINRGDGAAYHTTGSFPQLMLDAAHKTLTAAYDEAPVTYPIWARTGSAVDFKQFHRTKFGELPEPEVVPENQPYPEKAPSDDREFARVEKHGEIFSISFEAIVGDDLSAISRIPAMQGNAMRRKINRTVYAILTGNPELRDGIALFHASSHGANLDATALAAGAPLDTGFNVMMTQSGLNTQTILNIIPQFLIVPAALSATALTITRSMADPAVGGDTTGHSGVENLYGPGGPRPLSVVVEGQIDVSTTTGWWLASSKLQVDTVEVVFLQGEESPALSREDGFSTDTVKYKIRQSFVAFPVDFRGLYQGNG